MILCQCMWGDLLGMSSLEKGNWICGQLGQVPDDQGTSMEEEWVPPIVNIMQIAHGFFYLTTGPHVLIQFFFTPPTCIFFVSPTPLPLRFCLIFSSFFITELKFCRIFSPCSQLSCSQVRTQYSHQILSQSCQHPFSVRLRLHKSSFHQVAQSNAKPSSGLEFLLSSSLPPITASHFVHSLFEHSCQRSEFLQICDQIQ